MNMEILQLMNILNLEWDAEGRSCLETFRVIRDSLSTEFGLPIEQASILQEYANRPPYPSHEIIIAEVMICFDYNYHLFYQILGYRANLNKYDAIYVIIHRTVSIDLFLYRPMKLLHWESYSYLRVSVLMLC